MVSEIRNPADNHGLPWYHVTCNPLMAGRTPAMSDLPNLSERVSKWGLKQCHSARMADGSQD